MDFSYIASQTFGDVELERELLALFASQACRLLLDLPNQDARGQRETAHLLKGSAWAVGATQVAVAAEAYEAMVPAGQPVSDAAGEGGCQAGDPPSPGRAGLRPAATAFEDRAHAFQDLAGAIEAATAAIARRLDEAGTRPI